MLHFRGHPLNVGRVTLGNMLRPEGPKSGDHASEGVIANEQSAEHRCSLIPYPEHGYNRRARDGDKI